MTRKSLRVASCLALALASLTPASPAHAHRNLFPKKDRLEVSGDRLKLVVRYDVDEDDASGVRDRLDRDGDGGIDEREARAASHVLALLARRGLEVTVDGIPLALELTAVTPYGLARSEDASDAHMAVDLVLEGTLPRERAFLLSVSDSMAGVRAVPLALKLEGARVEGPVTSAAGGVPVTSSASSEAAVPPEVELEPGHPWSIRLRIPR